MEHNMNLVKRWVILRNQTCSVYRWPVGVVCDFTTTFEVCGSLSCSEDQMVTVTQNTAMKMMWFYLVLSTCAAGFVELSFGKKERRQQSKPFSGQWHSCLLYRCLFLEQFTGGAVHRRRCWKFVLCASDRLNQTIKRHFRFYWSHEKYPLIVRLCLSRNSASCTTSYLFTAVRTLDIVQALWDVKKWSPVRITGPL